MTWTLPKALRVFLKNDKSLFADISKMIFKLKRPYHKKLCPKSFKLEELGFQHQKLV